MVFSDADPSFGISDILRRLSAPSVSSNTLKRSPVSGVTGSSRLNGNTSKPITSTASSRPSDSSTSGPSVPKTQRPGTTSTISRADGGSLAKKRKVDESQKTSMELLQERKEMLKRLNGRSSGVNSTNNSGSTSRSSPPLPPASKPSISVKPTKIPDPAPKKDVQKPMSYRERLAAAMVAESEKTLTSAGGITHKATVVVEKKKLWQKKHAAEVRKKLAGVPATGGKAGDLTVKLAEEGVKSVAPKKGLDVTGRAAGAGGKNGANRGSGIGAGHGANSNGRKLSVAPESTLPSKGKIPDKGRSGMTDAGLKRKRENSPKSGYRSYGDSRGNIYGSSKSRNGYGASKRCAPRLDSYEEDDPDDDFVVNDEDDDEFARDKIARPKRYSYANSDSGSDMEATGVDILEEEERSWRVAAKEDAEQERLEKRLAARKAALKKKVAPVGKK